MKRLIVLEGADGLGKSTQAAKLVEWLNGTLLSQPNESNTVGFIRKEAKHTPDFGATERQLMMACSHITDAYDVLRSAKSPVVMDRSYLSGLIYGKLTGVPAHHMAVIERILRSTYQKALAEWQVTIIHLTAERRLDDPDGDVFERSIKWDKLRDEYVHFFRNADNFPMFSESELSWTVDVTGMDINKVFYSIKSRIGV